MKLRTRGRFNLKRWSRVLGDRVRGTAFDRALDDAGRHGRSTFVFGWNRGLGDIALGLVPLFARIRKAIPASRIEVFTRDDLAEPFALTDVDAIHVVPGLARGAAVDVRSIAARMGVALPTSAVLLCDPDPTRWLDGRRTQHPPSLRWDARWNALADALVPAGSGETFVGAHVSSETAQYYGYIKDWPDASWRELVSRFPPSSGVRFLLLGNVPTAPFAQDNVVDLRGRTTFLALLAVIRTRCRVLIAPDSGVLTAAYYLAQDFPLDVVSLWSDPRQGILKQACPSPNPRLVHRALVGRDESVANIGVDDVEHALTSALAMPEARAHAQAH